MTFTIQCPLPAEIIRDLSLTDDTPLEIYFDAGKGAIVIHSVEEAEFDACEDCGCKSHCRCAAENF